MVLAAAVMVLAGTIASGLALRLSEPPATELDPPALESALTEVLEGVYTAFAETDEARIYDGLAEVVAGDLATELYLQRRTVQVADHAEGGETDVLSIELFQIEAEPLPRGGGYRIDAAWRVVGRVTHRTHVHERINLYAADLTLAPVDGRWMLTRFALEDVDRAGDLVFEGGE